MNNQEAIKAMHNLNMVLSITPSEREAVNMAIAALEEQQSRREWYQKGYADGKKDAENDRWIPVEARLPGFNAFNPITRDAYVYPVTIDLGGITDIRYYSFWKGYWYNRGPEIMDDLVIAWQPLPEPYKPEKGDK